MLGYIWRVLCAVSTAVSWLLIDTAAIGIAGVCAILVAQFLGWL